MALGALHVVTSLAALDAHMTARTGTCIKRDPCDRGVFLLPSAGASRWYELLVRVIAEGAVKEALTLLLFVIATIFKAQAARITAPQTSKCLGGYDAATGRAGGALIRTRY
jgi:hypothetical protein